LWDVINPNLHLHQLFALAFSFVDITRPFYTNSLVLPSCTLRTRELFI
jgi:hypothetical protein